MEVSYLCMQGLQGISSFLEEEFYEVERNIPFNKTEVDLKAVPSVFIYGFISVLVFFILLSLCTACYYHFKTFAGNYRESTDDESNSMRSSAERQSTQSNNICTATAEDGLVSYQHFSDESIFDGGDPNRIPTSCVELILQRRRNAEIENSVRLAYGIDPIDLAKVSPKESDDCSVFQTAIKDSQISLSNIVSSISGDEASSASKFAGVSSVSENNKSLGSGSQSLKSDTNETYLDTRSAILENNTSSVSISDNATLEKTCPQCHRQRRRIEEIENSVRLAYGIDPIDLSKISPEDSGDCIFLQTAIKDSQISLSDIVSSMSGDDVSSASIFESVSPLSESKSSESDTNKTYLDTRSAISGSNTSSVSILDNATLEIFQSKVSMSHSSACRSTSLDRGSKGDLSLYNKDSIPKGDAPVSSSETNMSTISRQIMTVKRQFHPK